MILFLVMRIDGLYRKVVVILLLAAFTMITFSQSFITLTFFMQRDFIANNLCINKEKPQMHCKGNCQLMKKLKQEQKNDQENPIRKTDAKKHIVYTSATVADSRLKESRLRKLYPFFTVQKTIDRAGTLLRPPDFT